MKTGQVLGFVTLGTLIGIGAGVGLHIAVPASPYATGILIDGHRLEPNESVAALLEGRRESVLRRELALRHGDDLRFVTYEELGIDVDIEATAFAASREAHEGSILTRVKDGQRARRGEVDVPLTYWLNEVRARSLLEKLAKEIDREPVDARLDLENMRKVDEVKGLKLDIDATLSLLGMLAHQELEAVDLVVREVSAHVGSDDVAQVDIEKKVSTFETTFHTWGVGVGRSKNIREAAKRLDGVIIKPGEVVSFNTIVGPRTLERGFAWAPEIQGDEMTTGVGGGTCQASTTLFGAALFGALEVVERQSHSRPSSYTKMGLDATVSWPSTDLKIKNPLPFPVMIHAYLPDPGKIRVDILGGDPVADVTYTYGVGSTEDFVRRITVKSFLPPGKRIKRQKGSRGYSVTSLVNLRYKDGRTETKTFFSGYRPAPEVFWVAPGYDERELPELPAHARGVEGRTPESDPFPTAPIGYPVP